MIRRPNCTYMYLLLLSSISLPVASSIRIHASIAKFAYPIEVQKTRGGSTPNRGITLTKKGSTHPTNKKGSTQHSNKEADNDHDDEEKTNQKISYNLFIRKRWARFLYLISALNPFLAVWFNDYARMIEKYPKIQNKNVLAKTYETLFFFAKLKPRVSFAIGAVFRALQLSTAFQYVFDPSIGVGFGLNLLALWAKSRWPATVVLGWTITMPMWKILGACPPSGLPVPITVTWKTPKDSSVATKGYRIGL